jgi:4-amino-4-deoxy-L-arabinose transferase-like glycosyltransferase
MKPRASRYDRARVREAPRGPIFIPGKIMETLFTGKATIRWILPHAAILVVALIVGLYHVNASGPLWPDAPRYANAGAMIHDWLRSGKLLEPYEFAKLNYSQYPAFSVPYHPIGYPFFLGLLFLFTGVSYLAARSFVAICLGISGCIFFGILRKLENGRGASILGALLLISMPEILRWSRDTMSEIPALMFILAATLLFQYWIESRRPSHCWGAFALAALAFQCRVTTIGILPQWFLSLIWLRRWRTFLSRHLLLASLLFLIVCSGWIVFSMRFSRFETWDNHATNRLSLFSWENLSFYPSCMPAMSGWALTLAAIAGAIYGLSKPKRGREHLQLFWLFWFFAYYGFQLLLSINEQRYFLLALPSLPGLAVLLISKKDNVPRGRFAWCALLGVALALNLGYLFQMPAGIVGYDAVAKALSRETKPGNVLVACFHDQELIFRFREWSTESQRIMIRSDRSLAIRLSKYTGVKPQILAHQSEDLFSIVLRGRVRYMITCSPQPSQIEDRPEEMVLAHRVAESHPERFALIGEFPLFLQIGGKGSRRFVYIWEYLGVLPPGPSEIPVVIPTANLQFKLGE